jgi:chromosome segregation ATPase
VESARAQALAATEALRSEAERLRSAMIQHSETVAGLDVRAGELEASVVSLQRKEQALVERLQMLHRQQLRVETPAG